MTLEEAIMYYGSQRALCIALGLSPQAMTNWKRTGMLPFANQARIEKMTNGVLKADEFEQYCAEFKRVKKLLKDNQKEMKDKE